ncbi:GNAT family N-acetyltransferase [Halovenus sp. WSH3]|uniref:tRNA(Met) cytidine acetyltransferase TmcA n=1 Tax=Halovenus carboxidivorans TaxID=2692199 RepID=A0A6B0T5Z3_9EURY|nr:tRNA(Met) cytidine acetyltransferase TmcA [Halovenus carboxidivorans]MXR51606.1 GNAT family N-acetyltransferase [Halovenus carboxidivorans]
MELAARLRAQARRSDQRRLLVVTGEAESCRERARAALDATDVGPGETTYVGPAGEFHCESVARHEADRLLGQSREAVVIDCHERCEPNTLGKLLGVVSGGGLLVLLAPPLAEWPDRRDGFDRSLAVPPFEVDAVGSTFRTRLVETLREHRGIVVVDADTGEIEVDGRFEAPPRLPDPTPTPPDDSQFPRAAFAACRTADQAAAVSALESLREPGTAVVVESNRGRGKSSAAGLAAGALAHDGTDVLVTAPTRQSAGALFDRAEELLDTLGGVSDAADLSPSTGSGRIRYERPAAAADLPGSPGVVFVDEAAALPVRLLESLLEAPSVAFTTTIHGYEGAGRGFSIRFRDRLADSDHDVSECSLAKPIRYAPADPIEVWSFRALALDAAPAADQLVDAATPESVRYRRLSGAELGADEHLLREVFGLLVAAHYRTDPNDLARLLDAPNVSVHCLFEDGHVAAVALCAREGGFSAELRERVHDGERVRGNLVPDVLTSQLRDRRAGEPVGWRVMRIATHEAVRSRGLGSALLDHVRAAARAADLDYLGVSYGVTPGLAGVWADNGFGTVHLSTTRNDRSGEHSVLMLDPLSPAGEALFDRHSEWFCRRAPAAIRESLSDADPAVVRAACRTARATPALDLSDAEWRHAADTATGRAIFETAPRGPQRLCFRHLVDPTEEPFDADQRELLVRKGVQGQSWERASEAVGFHSEASCKRTMGEIIGRLVDLYGEDRA